MMITSTMEEFTFPIITTNNVVRLEVLPPLWRISSINHQSDHEFEFQENGRKRHICRSFSEVEDQIMQKDAYGRTTGGHDEKVETEEAEEKMDMLWEDFNEELQGSCHYAIGNSSFESSGSDSEPHHHHYYHQKYNTKNLEEGFQTAEEYNNNTSVHEEATPTKKKNMELVLRMMKKLGFLQKKARIKKKGHNYY